MPVKLDINESELLNIIKKVGTPFHIYDEKLIVDNLNNFLNCMTDKFKDFRQYFAVKALPNPNILKILLNNGSYLDCSSLTELKIANLLNVSGEKIMFTSNYTSKEDLEYAINLDAIINLDDITLLDTIKSIGNLPSILSFRLNPGIGKTDSETVSNILGGKDAKFGISTDDIVKGYSLAKELGIKKFGIHMMTGSNVLDLTYWEQLIEILFENINKIYKEVNIIFDFINIGGGIGIPYKENDNKVNIEDFSSLLLNKIKTMEDKYNIKSPKLYMENGRYITGPYGWLISKCNVIKESYATFYGLDACMSNLMRPGMYGAYHHITILGKDNCDKVKANVVGTLCENNDWFAKDRELPKANVGDIFIIHDCGAHAQSMGFQYNGKLRAPEVLYKEDKSIQMIRRRETFEDYIGTIQF
jgi:diaminopimelate decarboxylase